MSVCMCVGQYAMTQAAYLSAVGRSPGPPPPHPFSTYAAGVFPSPLDAVARHPSSPAPSDLRAVLEQPSRLAQQEQQQLMLAKLAAGVPRTPTGPGEACRSPTIALGQHRMPFTIPEPRSVSSARAEPKAMPQSTPPEPPLQRLPPPSSGSATDLGGHSASELIGGSFAAGRLEPPRSAAAMLSNTFIGCPPSTPVDLVMAQFHHQHHHHPQQPQPPPQHAVDLGVLHPRFHPVARPGLEAGVRVQPPSTAAFSPALPGMLCPPTAPPPAHAPASVPNCVGGGRESPPLVSSTSTLGDLQNEAFIMNTTKVLEVTSASHFMP